MEEKLFPDLQPLSTHAKSSK